MKSISKNKIIRISALLLAALVMFSFGMKKMLSDDWVVPAKYKSLKNPTDPSDKENMAVGKTLWAKHCKSCHGKTGEGDGSKAEELDTPCGDFTEDEFQSQTDGELFYKTSEGRDDMGGYEKKIPDDEDRWLLVNYMRTFK